MSFPIKPGDDCLLVFSERSIDFWHDQGGTQEPSDWRMHDINDAFVLPGVRSRPAVPGGVNGNMVQLRSDDGSMVVQMDHAGGVLTIKSRTKIVLDCPQIECTGALKAKNDIRANDGALGMMTHRHGGVQTGGGQTGTGTG